MSQILGQAKTLGTVEQLCLCLASTGSCLVSGSCTSAPVASEACKALWGLISGMNIIANKGQRQSFPLAAFHGYNFPRRDEKSGQEDSKIELASKGVIKVISTSLIEAKNMHVAVCYALLHGSESAVSSVMQILLQCCVLFSGVCDVLSGIVNQDLSSLPSSGGGEGTIIGAIFKLVLLYSNAAAAAAKESDTLNESDKAARTLSIEGLTTQTCLLLSAVAQGLRLHGRYGASHVLTTSQTKQRERLTALAHLARKENPSSEFPPLQRCSAAMLALVSIITLEQTLKSSTNASPLAEMAFTLTPQISAICIQLRQLASTIKEEKSGLNRQGGKLSVWHGLRDGYVGVLEARLRWGGAAAAEQACTVGIPLLLISLLAGSPKSSGDTIVVHQDDSVGLSPAGVIWAVSAIYLSLPGGSFRDVLLKRDPLLVLLSLLTDPHLKHLKLWDGYGGGCLGVREMVSKVIDIIEFPFTMQQQTSSSPSTSVSLTGGLLGANSSGGRAGLESGEFGKAVSANIPHYWQLLQEVHAISPLVRCLEVLDVQDLARPVALIARMVQNSKTLATELLREGLLSTASVAKTLDSNSPNEVIVDVLMIISDLARMSKDFYEAIGEANVLEHMKFLLNHPDTNIRSKACSALGNMCRHTPYFYKDIVKHDIVNMLIDRCADPDRRTRKFACFAVGNAAYYSDYLYEHLRRCIPHLTNLLLGDEEDKTKANAAGALSNLVRNSSKLCDDIISKGAMQALLQLITDCSSAVLSSAGRRDSSSESPLKIALFSLGNMCIHASCRQYLRSPELFHILKKLKTSSDPTIIKYISRITSKFPDASSAQTR